MKGDRIMRPQYLLEITIRIEKMQAGNVFTAVDFFDIADTDPVNKALSRLCEEKKIRRIMQGVYDKPEYSEFFKEYSAPRMDKVSEALARKFNWTIAPAGDVALNMLHLSTQVPNVWLYASDGPNREYKIGNTILKFKKTANREMSNYSLNTMLVIQALKTIGKERVSHEDIQVLRTNLTSQDKKIILAEARTATAWVYQYIKRICEGER